MGTKAIEKALQMLADSEPMATDGAEQASAVSAAHAELGAIRTAVRAVCDGSGAYNDERAQAFHAGYETLCAIAKEEP